MPFVDVWTRSDNRFYRPDLFSNNKRDNNSATTELSVIILQMNRNGSKLQAMYMHIRIQTY